jgi:hypothetical protein
MGMLRVPIRVVPRGLEFVHEPRGPPSGLEQSLSPLNENVIIQTNEMILMILRS